MRLTKFNPESGQYEYIEKAKTLAEFRAQRKAVIQRLGEYEDKASDVAEKIFAEIEKEIELALDSNYKVKRDAQDMNDTLVIYVEGKIDCLRGLLGFIAELKEKYTEEGK